MTFESVLQHDIKPFGRWQFQTFVLFLLPNTISVVLLLRFANISPPFLCAGFGQNWSFVELRTFSAAVANLSGSAAFDATCQRFSGLPGYLTANVSMSEALSWLPRDSGFSNGSLEACDVGDWRYDRDSATFRRSLIESFDLVCDRQFLIPFPAAAFCFGSILGSSLGGALADNFGRKRVLCVIQPLVAVILALLYFCASFWLLVSAYFFLGLIAPVSYTVGYILCTEITDYRHRNTFALLDGIICQIFGYGSVVLVSYLAQDWRLVSVCIAAIYALALVYPVAIPESPKWLIAKGQHEAALRTIRSAIRCNVGSSKAKTAALTEQDIRLPLRPTPNNGADDSQTATCCHSLIATARSYRDFLTNPLSRRRWLPLSIIWFLSSVTYLSASFYTVRLDFNAYLVAVFGLLLAFPAKLLRWLLYRFFDRKWPLVVLFFVQAALCSVAFLLFLFATSHLGVVIAVTIAFSLTSSSQEMLHVYSPELFPTLHRSNAVGFLGAVNGIGTGVGMFVERLDGVVWRPLPLLVFVVCHFACGLSTMLLPQSDPAKMPDFYQNELELEMAAAELRPLEDAAQT